MARLRAAAAVVLVATSLLAQERAQPKASAQPAHPKSTLPAAGAISDGVYRNPSFGFSYKIPFGWVDRTADMQDDSVDGSKSRLLLAVFERPPDATGDTINSAVVIAAEPLAVGQKTASEYFESLAELTSAKGFQAAGDPQEISIGITNLVRGDFTMARGKLTMRQTSLVALEKGYAISFTFITGGDDDVNELVEKLNFPVRKPLH
jgi:hypothetical protein